MGLEDAAGKAEREDQERNTSRQKKKKKRKKRGEDTEAATRGGDLWWDYRWRYFFITVSPGCFSFLFFVVPTRFGWLAPPPRLPSSTLPISPYDATYTPRALCPAQLVGGCILITFMSSDIPARFIALTPADSAKPRNQPPPSPFLFATVFLLLSLLAPASSPFHATRSFHSDVLPSICDPLGLRELPTSRCTPSSIVSMLCTVSCQSLLVFGRSWMGRGFAGVRIGFVSSQARGIR